MEQKSKELPSLKELFKKINQDHFGDELEVPNLFWNSRLRTSAGRFIPCARKWFGRDKPTIDIASYLLDEEGGFSLVWDTVAHEMIHYWLWTKRRPYGHSQEFIMKMKTMGVSRYNPVPKFRSYKYLYRCPHCNEEFPARRRLKTLACASCCQKFNSGQYSSRFKLYLEQKLDI